LTTLFRVVDQGFERRIKLFSLQIKNLGQNC